MTDCIVTFESPVISAAWYFLSVTWAWVYNIYFKISLKICEKRRLFKNEKICLIHKILTTLFSKMLKQKNYTLNINSHFSHNISLIRTSDLKHNQYQSSSHRRQFMCACACLCARSVHVLCAYVWTLGTHAEEGSGQNSHHVVNFRAIECKSMNINSPSISRFARSGEDTPRGHLPEPGPRMLVFACSL